MSQKLSYLLFCCLSILVFDVPLNHLPVPSTSYTQNVGWSVPQIIPGFDMGAWPPILIADQNRQVHAFSSQWVEQGDGTSISSIVYNRWTLGNGWTEPVDMILSPSGEARLTDAYLDREGTVHIVFWSGNNISANIYYSRSELETIGQVTSWSAPVSVVEDAGEPPAAVFMEDNAGDLMLIYNGRQVNSGVYIIKSLDRGETWSRPTSIFLTDSAAPLAWNIQIVHGNSGWLHVIWNVITTGGQGRGIYYARTQGDYEWTKPILLDSAEDGYGTQTPAIIEYNDELLAFFSGIYMRRSLDNGETWSDSGKIFFRHIGVNGSLSPVVDGGGTLHLFFGQRITGSPDIHGMWHSTFINDRWTEPEAIIKGPAVNDLIGDKSFDPYEAHAVVSQGNVLLVTWRTDPGLRGNGVWYSYKVLEIPETPVISSTLGIPLEIPSTPNGTDDIGPSRSVVTEIPTNNNQLFDKHRSTVYNFGHLIFLGVLPVIILIVILIISRFRYTNRL